jgi:hypothetical protein
VDFAHDRTTLLACLLQYSTSGLVYTFSSLSIHAIAPVSGPTRGGTRIVIRLNKPMALSKLQCRFGPQLVPASFDSMSIVLCYSPPAETAASVAVSLATAAALLDSTASFRYDSEIEVRALNKSTLTVYAQVYFCSLSCSLSCSLIIC